MHVIQIVPSIAQRSSGPSYSVRRLTEALQENRIDCTLAALEFGGEPELDYLELFQIGLGPRRLGRSRTMLRFLERQAWSACDDLVLHSHGMWQMNAIYPGWIARRTGVPLIVSPRGAFSKWAMGNGSRFKSLFWPIVQRPALRSVSCFHATSAAEIEDIRRLGFKQPVALIPNGIDLPEVCREAVKSDAHMLLFLGRLHPVKGIDMLLEVWGRLQDEFPSWSLVIAGGDRGYYGKSRYMDELVRMAGSLGLNRVTFAGEQDAAQKAALYSSAKLYVLPSRSENFGITVAEALASGVPAIVTQGAPWSQLEIEGAGWWVETEAGALENGLRAAMTLGSNELHSMGQRARAWMERDHGWNRVAEEMTRVYRWLVNPSEPVPDCVEH